MEILAGTVRCVNAKIDGLIADGKKRFPLFKQIYFNEAALLFTRLLRQQQRKKLRNKNRMQAAARRPLALASWIT